MMDYAILLSFEQETDKQIRKLMQELVAGGVNDRYLLAGLRPHLTLAEFNTQRMRQVHSCLTDLSGRDLKPLRIKLASAGFFPGDQGVLFLAPIVDEALLRFHRQVNNALEPLCDDFSPLYREENWVPHCTLALGLDERELARAGMILNQTFQALDVLAVHLNIVACCPFSDQGLIDLTAETA